MDDILFQRTAQGVTSPQTGLILPEEIMVFDTETTGLSKERDDILQFSGFIPSASGLGRMPSA